MNAILCLVGYYPDRRKWGCVTELRPTVYYRSRAVAIEHALKLVGGTSHILNTEPNGNVWVFETPPNSHN